MARGTLRNGVVWHTGAASGVAALDQMLDGSGGNALHAALALCDRVSLYGAGLYSAGDADHKVYAHSYDTKGVPRCITGDPPYRFSTVQRRRNAEAWLSARVHSQLMLSLLHAMGIVRWVHADARAAAGREERARAWDTLPASCE